jgi:hypothetical protein
MKEEGSRSRLPSSLSVPSGEQEMFTFSKLAPVRAGHLLSPTLLFFIVAALAGCSLRGALGREQLGDVAYFEYREARSRMAGVVIGTPHGAAPRVLCSGPRASYRKASGPAARTFMTLWSSYSLSLI